MAKETPRSIKPWIINFYVDGEDGIEAWEMCLMETGLEFAIISAKERIRRKFQRKKFFIWDAGLASGTDRVGEFWVDQLAEIRKFEF